MGTLGRSTRNGKKKATTARIDRGERPHPAIAKLAAALKAHKEALERQAATAEILKVISRSPNDVQPVFDAIAKNAKRLLGAFSASVTRRVGDALHLAAVTTISEAANAALKRRFPVSLSDTSRQSVKAALTKAPAYTTDTEGPEAPPATRELGRVRGYRSSLAVPMLLKEEAIGTIAITRREPGAFSKHDIELLQAFADQAVIAIENVRLFNETKEALQQQRATSQILGVISTSPTDSRPVFEAILKKALELCEAHLGLLNFYDGERLRTVAQRGGTGEFARWLFERGAVKPDGDTILKALGDARPAQIADARQSTGYIQGKPNNTRFVDLGKVRTFLAVPLVREGKVIGNIGIYRPEVRPFTDKQIALVQTFADQAVIAIENARLFNETKESLEQQTAISEVLRVISDSPTDVKPVLDAVAVRAARICEASDARIFLVEGDHFRHAAGFGDMPVIIETFPLNRDTPSGRAVIDRMPQQVEDIAAVPMEDFGLARENAQRTGSRTILSVPLLREERALGTIVLRRREVRPFTEKQIALLQTFAHQAAIAIENVRLFNETKEALEHQRASADILRIVASSVEDTDPVFAAITSAGMRLLGIRVSLNLAHDGQVHYVSHSGVPEERQALIAKLFPRPLDRQTVIAASIVDSRIVHVPDIAVEKKYPVSAQTANVAGWRAMLAVPLIEDGKAIGCLGMSRPTPGPFSDKQIELAKTFADQAVIAIRNAGQFREIQERNAELKQALERQTGTSEILRVISSSPNDLQPVFDTIVRSFISLCGAVFGAVFTHDKGLVHYAASAGFNPEQHSSHTAKYPVRVDDPSVVSARTIFSKAPVEIQDALADPHYDATRAAMLGVRRILGVPMLRDGEPLGAIVASWSEPGATPKQHLDLLKTFADQAVIAIENVRLFNETKEALEHQQASADILRIVSQSVADSKPAFEAILAAVRRLFASFDATVWRVEQDRLVAVARGGPTMSRSIGHSVPITQDYVHGIAVLERKPICVDDVASSREITEASRQDLLSRNRRAVMLVPFVRDGDCVGAISISRTEPYRFSEKEVALLKTFASQAVIAIENARLFNETKEALERQTATAEILKVISSSPTDVQPVLDVVAESAARLCESEDAVIRRLDADGLRRVAHFRSLPSSPMAPEIRPLVPSSLSGRAVLERRAIHVEDMEKEVRNDHYEEVRVGGAQRTMLAMPLLRESSAIGVILIRRKEVRPFSDKQIALLKIFADQAVIAIENARLFNETKEALERQTATADILKVMSGSPTDVQPVFDAIVRSAARLFGRNAALRLVEGDEIRRRAHSWAAGEFHGQEVLPIDRDSVVGRAVVDGKAMQVVDTTAPDAPPYARANWARLNFRSNAAAPLLRDGAAIGVISVSSKDPGALSDKQMALLQTFADQAVIAIENVRLFKELQERTEALTKSVGQLTALGEVGRAISSTLELETVLRTIVQHAVQLTGVDSGAIYEYDEGAERFTLQAAEKFEPELVEAVRSTPIRKGDGATGRIAVTLEAEQVPDIEAGSYRGARKNVLVRAGYRAILAVPLLRENHLLGALQVFRRAPGPFAPEVVELLKTFATQSALAIQNARLFREIAEKGRQLEVASQHKSQFLASMSHELRTPLNALLGFNEMILGEVYGEVPGDMRPPLAQMQSSGKHLLRLINNVLDLAKIEAGHMELALAEYSVQDAVETVRSTLEPLAADKGLELRAAVPADIPLAYGDSGRITQCLMNLAGNSLKFTKAGKVEISVAVSNGQLRYSVADTGIGIPADKLEGLFTEFKQTDATVASEYGGTGLGLSISKKFVEMHGGRIWVQSEPGRGSIFTFEVPLRARQAAA